MERRIRELREPRRTVRAHQLRPLGRGDVALTYPKRDPELGADRMARTLVVRMRMRERVRRHVVLAQLAEDALRVWAAACVDQDVADDVPVDRVLGKARQLVNAGCELHAKRTLPAYPDLAAWPPRPSYLNVSFRPALEALTASPPAVVPFAGANAAFNLNATLRLLLFLRAFAFFSAFLPVFDSFTLTL